MSLTFHLSFLGSSPVMSPGFSWIGSGKDDHHMMCVSNQLSNRVLPHRGSFLSSLSMWAPKASYFSASFSSHQKDARWGHHSVQCPLPKTTAKTWNWFQLMRYKSDSWFKSNPKRLREDFWSLCQKRSENCTETPLLLKFSPADVWREPL